MRVCRGCSTSIDGLRPRAKWCSDACRVRVYRIRMGWVPKPKGSSAGERAKARTASIQRHPLRGLCQECGAPFPVGRRMDARYCVDECLEAVVRRNGAASNLGRGSLRVRDRERLSIFERDDWVCQLCGDPVDRSAKWPDPESPVVDHWVPLALGGDHEPGNWVTAHRLCNDMKKARHPGELGLRRPAHLPTTEEVTE